MAEIREEHLPCADYIIGSIRVERKTAADLRASLNNGRLFSQLSWLRSMFKRRILIIEGRLQRLSDGSDRVQMGEILITVSSTLQISILRTSDQDETARLIVRLAKREASREPARPGAHAGRKPLATHLRQRYVLGALPHVGPKRAESLLSHFGTLKNVFAASEDELLCDEQIGPQQAQAIHELANASWPSLLATD